MTNERGTSMFFKSLELISLIVPEQSTVRMGRFVNPLRTHAHARTFHRCPLTVVSHVIRVDLPLRKKLPI